MQLQLNRYPIAIDLGDGSCATALQMTEHRGVPAVRAKLDHTDTAAGLSDQDAISFVRDVIHNPIFTGKRVALLPPPGTILNYALRVSVDKGESLEDAIVRETQSALDMPLDQAVIDYISVQPDPLEPKNSKQVSIVAIRNSDVDKLTGIVEKAGGILESIEPPVTALLRAHSICNTLGAEPSLLCYLGRSHTTITVASAEGVLAMRDVSWCTNRMRRKLADNMDLQNEQRDIDYLLSKRGVRGTLNTETESSDDNSTFPSAEGTVAQLLEPLVDELVHELHSILGYVRSLSPSGRFESTCLYGEGAHVAGLGPYIERELGMPVTDLSPIAKIANGKTAQGQNDSACYTLSLGLGLRKLRWL
jgi:type IV pilus assembly protein PilM